jgi:hypothetical protein
MNWVELEEIDCENEEKKKNGGLHREIKRSGFDFYFLLSII